MNTQLTLALDIFPDASLTLEQKIEWSLKVFDSLDEEKEYRLAFSGGKDSHVLLGIYLKWRESRQKNLKLNVVFSDTLLESQQLYSLIELTEKTCKAKEINFIRVKPLLEHNFWVILFGLGYPVPNHRVRWCTSRLKIDPMEKTPGIGITGSHFGESTKRDNRLKKCGSNECGINELSNTVEPLAIWRNCDIWDWIILYSDSIIYNGVSSQLLSTYNIAEDKNGSLRMGCFMCPVIAQSTTVKLVNDGIVSPITLKIREILEILRKKPRILSQRTKKNGAILVDARIEVWEKMKPFFPVLLENNWIQPEVIHLVEEMLSKRTYPPTYKQDWIKEQEQLLKSLD
jgi:DNA sulfur modification protein DndC